MDWIAVLGVLLSLWFIYRDNAKNSEEIRNEMKDFHGRMCTLEERYIQMMTIHNTNIENIWREMAKK